MNLKLGRRSFLSTLGAAGAGLFSSNNLNAAGLMGGAPTMSKDMPKNVDGDAIVPIKSGFCSTGNPWAELGITPVVNIQGTVTVIGGSVMKPEVMEAMRYGNMHFTVVDELEVAAGKFIANLCKSPAGYTGLVTGGAAAALLVGYAGMMTEDYNERMINIPDLRNFPKTEIIIQTAHRYSFDHQIRQTGAKLVNVTTRDEMIAAINPRTVAIHYTNIAGDRGQISGPETVAIAKQHGVYTFCDASADVPPVSRLWEYPAIGFDMFTFSGGKDISGPQASGILIGQEKLIQWALLNMSPQENKIGRASKVGKETIFGLLKALELFVKQDEDESMRRYDAKAQVITDALKKFGVTMSKSYDPKALGNVSPNYTWTWDAAKNKLTSTQVLDALAATKPVGIGAAGGANSGGMRGRPDPSWPAADAAPARRAAARPAPAANSIGFSTWLLKDGEDKYIADRLVEIFSAAKKS